MQATSAPSAAAPDASGPVAAPSPSPLDPERFAAFWRGAPSAPAPERRAALDWSNETYSALFEPFWQREATPDAAPPPPEPAASA